MSRATNHHPAISTGIDKILQILAEQIVAEWRAEKKDGNIAYSAKESTTSDHESRQLLTL